MATTRELSPSQAAMVSAQGSRLAESDRRLHRTLIDAVIAMGSVPSSRELADRLGTTEETIHAGLARLTTADYLARDTAGRVTCLYPFSATPTPHVAVINGQRRSAMCAIDALFAP